MTTYTTKALANKMGLTTGTVLEWGRRLFWEHRRALYGQGLVWNVTDEEIQEYFDLKARSNYTKEKREQLALAMFDLWDTAFFGKTFPRNVNEIDLTKWTVSYQNLEAPEVDETKSKALYVKCPPELAPKCGREGCEEPRVQNTYGDFYAYCRVHHNEKQRISGFKHRAKKKAQLLAEKINALNCKKELTSNSASV